MKPDSIGNISPSSDVEQALPAMAGIARPTCSLILLLLLNACTSFSDPVQTERDTHQRQLAALQHWELQGRLNIRSAEESRTVNLRWQQHDDNYDILLSGSLGIGAVNIHGDAQQLVLEQSNEPPVYADDLSQLGETYLGYAFPADHLLYWVKGNIAPDSPFKAEYNELGLLAHLQQDSWELEYDRYQRVDDINLPGRIKLQHPRYRLTFLIRRWTPGATP